jgi:uncharacterized protein (TIGR03067 family)
MPMIRVALIALVVSAATAAHGADPADDETKKLQGEWRAVEVKGKKVDKDDAEVKNLRLVIEGNGITLADPTGGGRERKKTFKLDPAKSPKEIDITSLDGQEKDQTAACIYKLDKDWLTICMPYFTKDLSVRPKEFKAGADDGMLLINLERVKTK